MSFIHHANLPMMTFLPIYVSPLSQLVAYFLVFKFPKGISHSLLFTRFSHQYRSHPARLKIKQLSINCLGPVLWNSLPEVIRKSPSMGSFKLSVKNSSFLINTE